MSTLTFDAVKVGDTLPPLTLAPINRTTLALFAGASGDHNPIHIDTRLRAPGRHARRVRARHAVDGLPRPPADAAGSTSGSCASSACASPASRTSATGSPAPAAWSRSSRPTASSA